MATSSRTQGSTKKQASPRKVDGDALEQRAVVAVEEIAATARSQVALALDAQGWRGGDPAAAPAPEQVVRSLTRWQGNDPVSLVRALQASFEHTTAQGRSVLRYRGAGRAVAAAGTAPAVGPGARALRRITPGLQDVLDLLDRLEPVAPTADVATVRSAAAVVRDRLESYAEELGRGYDARPGRLDAIRRSLRGQDDDLGGALKRLGEALGLDERITTGEEEGLVDDYLVLVDFVYALDGSSVPELDLGAGPSQWRDGVDDDLASVADLLQTLRTRITVQGISDSRLESRTFGLDGGDDPEDRQSVADVLDWAEDLVSSTAPRLLDLADRNHARHAIGAELGALTSWIEALADLSLFRPPLLHDALDDVRRGLERLDASLRRA